MELLKGKIKSKSIFPFVNLDLAPERISPDSDLDDEDEDGVPADGPVYPSLNRGTSSSPVKPTSDPFSDTPAKENFWPASLKLNLKALDR